MSSPGGNDGSAELRPFLLRRRDQQFLAGMTLIALLAIAGWWWQSGGLSGRLTEWDRLSGRTMRFHVNVNTATWPELAQLPEIGEMLARRIIENREAEGPFRSPEDLMRVRGIGEKTLELMRPYLSPESWPQEPST